MKFQSPHFSATPAQMRVLRAIYKGEKHKTNFATLNRIHHLLDFSGDKATVRAEVVVALQLDKALLRSMNARDQEEED